MKNPARLCLNFLASAAVLLTLVSCSAARREARSQVLLQSSLQIAAQDFWEAMRWERYDAAGLHAKDLAIWLLVSDTLLNNQGMFRITDATLISVEVTVGQDGEASTGQVAARYELTTLPTQKLERRSVIQTWVRVGGVWKLEVTGDEAELFLAEPTSD